MLQSLVVPALPTLQHDLDTTPTGVTWVFTAYLLSASVATPIAGRLGDMFGKKRTLLVVMAGLAGGSLIAALATTLPVLIAARTIQGTGGAMFPLAFGIIRDEFPRERVAAGIGLISGLLGIGGGLGIVLAGPILDNLGYHWLFWIPCAVILATAVATIFFIPGHPSSPRLGGLGRRCAALLLARLPAPCDQRGAAMGLDIWTNDRVARCRGRGRSRVGVVEARTRSALVDMQMMRLRPVWSTNVAGFLIGFGLFSAFVLIPQFVQTPPSNGYGFGSSVTQSGLFLIPSTLMMLIAAPFSGRLSRRYGSKVPLVLGAAITMLAFVFLAVAHSSHWQFYAASILLGVGVGFAFASLANLIVEAVRPDQTGVATGMNAVMRTIGGAIGGQVAASLLAASLLANGYPSEAGYTTTFVVMAGVLAASVAASLAVPGRRPHRAQLVTLAEAHGSLE